MNAEHRTSNNEFCTIKKDLAKRIHLLKFDSAWLVADCGSLLDPSHRRGQPNYQKTAPFLISFT